MGGAIFAQFFLLTLYMQEVLHYSALKTGVAYIGLTLTIIVFSAVAQALVTRIGVRRVLPAGLALSAVALVLFARLPVDGNYFTDLFPAFMISGLGLALAFVPMSIGGAHGCPRGGCRHRLGPDQHDAADRRRDRRRTGDHGRDDLHHPLRRRPRRNERLQRRRADARLPGRVLRPGRPGGGGRGAGRTDARVQAGRGASRELTGEAALELEAA